MDDARGISRGRCKSCSSCGGYIPPSSGLKCSQCGCRPAGHSRLDQSLQSQQGDTSIRDTSTGDTSVGDTSTRNTCTDQSHVALPISNSFASPLNIQSSPISSLCGFPNCNQTVDFDLNSGMESIHCHFHIMTASMRMFEDNQFGHGNQYEENFYQDSSMFSVAQGVQDNSLCIIPECFQPKYMDSGTGVLHDYCGKTHAQEGKMRGILPNIQDGAALPTPVQSPVVPTSRATCAITECLKACYVDDSGTVHECCGITHAMEHQRRLALWQQVNQQVVKGVTHCLLPGCNKHTWPFENYCGRTHANLGLQQGLVAPPVAGTTTASQAGPKDSSSCIIPGCQKPKFVDSSTGATYDYCGKSHADEGKRRGIYATADKVEDQCGLPGCSNRRKTEGGTVHDYCCLDHAQKDAPNRDARILTSMPEVQKFLQKFPNLKVASMKENDHAKPGGALFNKFRSAMMSLPTSQRNTCLAFHGTAESNIDSICTTGYDQKKRSGQAYGAGEYFATSPTIPLGYCKSGKKLLLNELLLGQTGTHHTKHGDIVVMKNPAHDLPRFVITFK